MNSSVRSITRQKLLAPMIPSLKMSDVMKENNYSQQQYIGKHFTVNILIPQQWNACKKSLIPMTLLLLHFRDRCVHFQRCLIIHNYSNAIDNFAADRNTNIVGVQGRYVHLNYSKRLFQGCTVRMIFCPSLCKTFQKRKSAALSHNRRGRHVFSLVAYP